LNVLYHIKQYAPSMIDSFYCHSRRAHLYPLQLHLLSQVARRRLNELLLGVPGTVAFFVLQKHHAAAYITGGDDSLMIHYLTGTIVSGLWVCRMTLQLSQLQMKDSQLRGALVSSTAASPWTYVVESPCAGR
jgi:hypothetical protein